MRVKTTLLAFFLIGGLLFNSSCKKAEETIVDAIKPEMSASIDGTSWKSSTIVVVKNNGKYTVTGTRDNVSIIMTITDVKVGKYPFDITNNSAIYSTGSNIGDQFIAGTGGELEITAVIKDGKEFEGKFNFVGINSGATVKSITGGTIINAIIP